MLFMILYMYIHVHIYVLMCIAFLVVTPQCEVCTPQTRSFLVALQLCTHYMDACETGETQVVNVCEFILYDTDSHCRLGLERSAMYGCVRDPQHEFHFLLSFGRHDE